MKRPRVKMLMTKVRMVFLPSSPNQILDRIMVKGVVDLASSNDFGSQSYVLGFTIDNQ